MLSVQIDGGAAHWQIFQREGGAASVALRGSFSLHPICSGHVIHSACVLVRVVREQDNTAVVPWTKAAAAASDTPFCGGWHIQLSIPQGGLYRIETALDVRGDAPEVTRLFGGAMRHHLGVGDLFVIAGQSNAAGFGADAAPDAPDLRVHLFRNCCQWDLATHPMNESTGADDALNAETGCCGTSPWLTFAKQLLPAAGCPIGLIQTAMGGQSIDRWDSRVCGDLLDNMLERIMLAGGKAAGILWYQGCTDAVPGKAERYGEQFCFVMSAIRRAVGEVPIFSMQLNRYLRRDGDDAAWGTLREQQRLAARQLPGVFLIPTTDLTLSDYIHNSSSANVLLGLRAAEFCKAALYGGQTCFAPDLQSAVMENAVVTLTFSHCGEGLVVTEPSLAARTFAVENEKGENIPISALSDDDASDGRLHLHLAKCPAGHGVISFASGCNPAASCVFDHKTRIPPLSFFRNPIVPVM